jgi:hypothetical protein
MNDNVVISIFSNNAHRSNHITHTILQELAKPEHSTNIIIITEPWIGTIHAETQEKGTVHHREWNCITPKNIETANVTIYHRRNAPFRTAPLNHLNIASDSILPIQITTNNQQQIYMIGVYNSPSTNSAAIHLYENQLPPGPTIMCGDFNLHSPEWDATITQTNEKA